MRGHVDGPVLLTGAAGFLGANLARRLVDDGARVHVVLRPSTDPWRLEGLEARIDVHRADLLDAGRLEQIVDECAPRHVFHLAAEGGVADGARARRRALLSSVAGTANLLEALQRVDCESLVHAGSFTEYGPCEERWRETDTLQPTVHRGAVKACAGLLCLQFAYRSAASVVNLRISSVYGYWEQPGRLIPRAIRAALRGGDISLTPPGYVHDLVFVDDVVDACLAAAAVEAPEGEVINVGSGVETANEEVVERIEQITGRPIRVRPQPYPVRPIDIRRAVLDISKAAERLGWRPRHGLRQGLEKTVAWFDAGVDERYGLDAGATTMVGGTVPGRLRGRSGTGSGGGR